MTRQETEFLLVPGELFLEARGARDGWRELLRTGIRSVPVRGLGGVDETELAQAKVVEGERSGLGSNMKRARDA